MALLTIDNLSAGYAGKAVLNGISFSVDQSQRWAIIGHNGTGKSTFIKTAVALLDPIKGSVIIDGKSVHGLSAKERARLIAYLPQKLEAKIPYSVYDFVMLGRFSAMGFFSIPDKSDKKSAEYAMDLCDVLYLKERFMSTLSGGEMQRVLLAGALAQETSVLFLDEPTTFLDPAHQQQFLQALTTASNDRKLTIIMVTHDINTALCACSHVVAFLDGRIFYAGDVNVFRAGCPTALESLFKISFNKYKDVENRQSVYGTWRNFE